MTLGANGYYVIGLESVFHYWPVITLTYYIRDCELIRLLAVITLD